MIVSRNQLDTKIITAFLYLPAYKETEPSHARSAPLVYHRPTIVSMERLLLCRRLVAQGRHRHSSGVVNAVDDVGAPDVVPEGEDLFPDITESMVAGLVAAALGIRIELRIGGLASLQGDTRSRAVSAHDVSRCVVRGGGHLSTRDVGDRSHTAGEVQVANDCGAFFVDVRRDVMHEAPVLYREHGTGIVRRRTDPDRIDRIDGVGGFRGRPLPDAEMVATAVTVEALLPVHVLRLAVQEEGHHGLLLVAAVIQQRIQILHPRTPGGRIGIVPSCFAKCSLDFVLGSNEDDV